MFAGQIEPWYQPIRRSGDASYFGAEVLARWHVPDGEVRLPADFLGAIEALGLLDTMMENMLRRAFREAAMTVDGSWDIWPSTFRLCSSTRAGLCHLPAAGDGIPGPRAGR